VKIADGEPRKRAITIYFTLREWRTKLAARTRKKPARLSRDARNLKGVNQRPQLKANLRESSPLPIRNCIPSIHGLVHNPIAPY